MKRLPLLMIASLACCAAPLAAAQDEALAALPPGPRQVVEKFLAGKAADGISTGAQAVQMSDLDGDGQDEIVLVWNQFYGNSSAATLSVLAARRGGPQKRRWHEAGSAALKGHVQALQLEPGGRITLPALTLGPQDARCCPSVKLSHRFEYRGGRLLKKAD